jgi:hypothetical protein
MTRRLRVQAQSKTKVAPRGISGPNKGIVARQGGYIHETND